MRKKLDLNLKGQGSEEFCYVFFVIVGIFSALLYFEFLEFFFFLATFRNWQDGPSAKCTMNQNLPSLPDKRRKPRDCTLEKALRSHEPQFRVEEEVRCREIVSVSAAFA